MGASASFVYSRINYVLRLVYRNLLVCDCKVLSFVGLLKRLIDFGVVLCVSKCWRFKDEMCGSEYENAVFRILIISNWLLKLSDTQHDRQTNITMHINLQSFNKAQLRNPHIYLIMTNRSLKISVTQHDHRSNIITHIKLQSFSKNQLKNPYLYIIIPNRSLKLSDTQHDHQTNTTTQINLQSFDQDQLRNLYLHFITANRSLKLSEIQHDHQININTHTNLQSFSENKLKKSIPLNYHIK